MPNSQAKINRRATKRRGGGNDNPLLVLVGSLGLRKEGRGSLLLLLLGLYNFFGNFEEGFHALLEVL